MKIEHTNFARALRCRETDAERKLWYALRDRRLNGWKFKRQVPRNGYIVDFLCGDEYLVVEVDGSQHIEDRLSFDTVRTKALQESGYTVLRFLNRDVLTNLRGVLESILDVLSKR